MAGEVMQYNEDYERFEDDDVYCPMTPVDCDGKELGPSAEAAAAPADSLLSSCSGPARAMQTPAKVKLPEANDNVSSPPLSSESQVAHQSCHVDVNMLASMPTPLRCNPPSMAVAAQADLVEDAVSVSPSVAGPPSSPAESVKVRRRLRGKQHPLSLPVLGGNPASDLPDAEEASVVNSIARTHRPYRQVQRKLAQYFETNKYHKKLAKKTLWSKVRNHNDRIKVMKAFLRSKGLKEEDDEVQKAAHEYITMAINNPKVGKAGGFRGSVPQKAKQASIDKRAPPAATAQSEDEDGEEQGQSQDLVGLAYQFTFYCNDDVFPDKYSKEHFPSLQSAAEALLQDERPRLEAQQDRILAYVRSDIVPTVGQGFLELGMQSEICPATWTAGVVRVHTHVQVNHKFMQVLKVKGKYRFERKWVCVQKTRVDRRHGKSTLHQAHYYVTMPKHGALLVGGDYLPHKQYRVMPQWIEGYHARGYLSDDVAIQEFLRAGSNCRNHVGHVRFRQEYFLEQKEELERQAVERQIQATLKPFKWIFTWHNFMNQFFPPPGEVFKRAACYVLDGESCADKSQFIRCQFPVGTLMSIDCSGGKIYPNYRKMERSRVKAIVHEEGTPKMVLQHKAAFQSSNAQIELGNSPVNEGVYYRWFYKIPMIITCNDWHSLVLKEKPDDIEWLNRNAIVQTCDANTLY